MNVNRRDFIGRTLAALGFAALPGGFLFAAPKGWKHGGKPADGSQPDATLVDVPWPCGKPVRDDGSLVPSAKLIKGQ